MDNYYDLLGVAHGATPEELAAAYHRQRERYSHERVAALGPEFQRIADERLSALERAYATLSDQERRRAYDQSQRSAPPPQPQRGGLGRRELISLIGGALVGLIIIAVVWNVAGSSAPSALPTLAQIDRPAADFDLPALDGAGIRLSDYRGKVVMVNFWYTDCPPCKEETPALQEIHQRLGKQDLVVIGVNVRGNEPPGAAGDEKIRAFTEQYGVTYPIAIDTNGDVGRAYQVYVLPTTFFIDPAGTVRFARFGPLTADEVERTYSALRQTAAQH
ncbi:MAG TPA: redoxin domain-containing protein [Roseiflexaceae bacterium]|nr:redoxin domain-containing protein [Roseiflexaceae bacterium]